MEKFERIKELKKERILERRRLRRNKILWHVAICSAVAVIILSVATVMLQIQKNAMDDGKPLLRVEKAPEMTSQIIPLDEYSRPGTKLEQVKGIVLHCSGDGAKAGSHYVIGQTGEIVQRIPLDEVSNSIVERAADTISIEVYFDNGKGAWSESAYNATVELTAWLVGKYDLKISDILRCHDVSEENCSKYLVDNEMVWEDFKLDVEIYIEENGVKK